MPTPPVPDVPTAAVLTGAEEVTVVGWADLSYWEGRLRSEGVTPFSVDGTAQVVITGTKARFHGIPFRELAITVRLAPSDGMEHAFLVHAFNSSASFAVCERVFFHTPYFTGEVAVSAYPEPAISLALGGSSVFEGSLFHLHERRQLEREESEEWAAMVHLPLDRRGNAWQFYAQLQGRSRSYAFEPATDHLILEAHPQAQVFRSLIESHFQPTEWRVRLDAVHTKSRTFRDPRGISR